MFTLEKKTGPQGHTRVLASDALTEADFLNLARDLGASPRRARKIGFVAARRAEADEHVKTRWDGEETTNIAKAGDYIVTNLSPEGTPLRDSAGSANTYVIRAQRFPELYERVAGTSDLGDIHRPRGVVEALFFPGGFDILAPWGKRQRANAGYILKRGHDIYGNNKETFEATYEIVN